MSIYEACLNVKENAQQLSVLGSEKKNDVLACFAAKLRGNSREIISENDKDIRNGEASGLKPFFLDRLKLDEKRLEEIAKGIEQVISFPDPVGKLLEERNLECGLFLKKLSVPLGVIGIIYEARPNVTADSIALCFKSGNACVLRGGKEALCSNKAIASLMREALNEHGLSENLIYMVEDTTHASAEAMMKMNGVIDVLIPRGGKNLIKAVLMNSSVPVIETGAGNCHAYVDYECDMDMAVKVVLSAKISRPSVCNSLEKLLVSEKIAEKFLPLMCEAFQENGVEIRGCEKTVEIMGEKIIHADEEDWYTEYNDMKIAIKVVSDVEEACEHIRKYSTHHSETIITENEEVKAYFTKYVDSAAVYVNASTRFTDGAVFGLGAEIGISTQKLHARGPMGLNELTSYKYVLEGSGEIR